MSMVITRTPLRISLLGGGSDFPQWYATEPGAVLSTTIDKYIYVTARYMPEFYPNGYRIVWKHIEQVGSIGEILHPTVKAALGMMGFEGARGVEITYHGDLPANSGMGTSSAFAVGLINALAAIKGEQLGSGELFLQALHLEQDVMKEAVGSQDQIAAAVGGMNLMKFGPGAAIALSAVDPSPLEGRLLMFYTGQTRLGVELTQRLVAGLASHTDALRRMRALAMRGAYILENQHEGAAIDDFGEAMHEAWEIKRGLAEGISNSIIDDIYKRARAAGAIGGKLCGAGSAGFMVFYVPPHWQDGVKDALRDLIHLPFKFEHRGSQIILNGEAK